MVLHAVRRGFDTLQTYYEYFLRAGIQVGQRRRAVNALCLRFGGSTPSLPTMFL